MNFEIEYTKLVKKTIVNGKFTDSRNGKTYNLLNQTLNFENFPHLNVRKLYYKGVVGELIAFMRGAQHVKSFQDLGCNYWNDFADSSNGNLPIQYGFKWFHYHGIDQFQALLENIRNDKSSSRQHMLLTWDPSDTKRLFPCHFAYQFYELDNKLHIIWYQRSADLILGVPSDAILAHLLLQVVCAETGKSRGNVHMNFGVCHIYQNHYDEVMRYLSNYDNDHENYDNYYIAYKSLNGLYEQNSYKSMDLPNFVHSGTDLPTETYDFKLNV